MIVDAFRNRVSVKTRKAVQEVEVPGSPPGASVEPRLLRLCCRTAARVVALQVVQEAALRVQQEEEVERVLELQEGEAVPEPGAVEQGPEEEELAPGEEALEPAVEALEPEEGEQEPEEGALEPEEGALEPAVEGQGLAVEEPVPGVELPVGPLVLLEPVEAERMEQEWLRFVDSGRHTVCHLVLLPVAEGHRRFRPVVLEDCRRRTPEDWRRPKVDPKPVVEGRHLRLRLAVVERHLSLRLAVVERHLSLRLAVVERRRRHSLVA
jgi:hypothetical protein